MPFCPACRSEYRSDVTSCAHCEVPLVAELPEADDAKKAERLREAVAKKEAKPIYRAPYSEACQAVEQLHAGGVDAMVVGDPASCGKGGQCSVFFVVVLEEDVKAANQVLEQEWRKLMDDNAELGQPAPDGVDLDAEGAKTCPACGANFEGTPEECPDCGLYLGAA